MSANRRNFLKGMLFAGAASLGAVCGAKSSKAGPKEDAPKAAYVICMFHIAGFQYYDGPELVHGIKEGDALSMVMEPDNPVDPFAVRLEWKGRKVGYVPRSDNGVVNPLLQQEAPMECSVYEVFPEANPWEAVLVHVLLVCNS